MEDIFADIRPYTDAEVAEVLPVLAKSKLVAAGGKVLFPGQSPDALQNLIASCRTVDEFQEKVISKVVGMDLEISHSSLTYSGVENFIKSDGSVGTFLMLSTHRDIVLDPALVQYTLFLNHLPTTEIAAGDNLLDNPEVAMVMRANRMVKVVRSDNARVVYDTSRRLSAYIRSRVATGEKSLWIAHRSGRTKDGCDCTEQGLLKMLDMSGEGGFVESFDALNIMPVTISYEYETCAALKALELYSKEKQGFYRKKPGEDANSMLQGFIQHKGRIHVDFCKPITREELLEADRANRNEKFRILASILDSRIASSFRLWPSNWAAADILSGGETYLKEGRYTLQDRENLIDHVKKECEGMPAEIYDRVLNIYAANIINKKQ